MEDILLSLLVPSVPERLDNQELIRDLFRQAVGKPVEVLVLYDNRKRTLGKKREALTDAAKGLFLCHLDDDDAVDQAFVDEVLKAIREAPCDVITYNQAVTLDGNIHFNVIPGLAHENEQARQGDDGKWVDIRRKPWHWCTWRTELVRQTTYPDITLGEDWAWIEQMLRLVKVEHHIDKVLHLYHFSSDKTLCKS